MSQREKDRQEVLAAVYSSIEQGMDSGSVGVYIDLARGYGQKHEIEVQSWWMAGRRIFADTEDARQWAQTLP